jgi:FMN reductase
LRGWPTPFGAGINTLETRFDTVDTCSDAKVVDQLATVGQQAAQFALAFNAHRTPTAAPIGNAVKEAQPARLLHAV